MPETRKYQEFEGQVVGLPFLFDLSDRFSTITALRASLEVMAQHGLLAEAPAMPLEELQFYASLPGTLIVW